MLKSGWHLVDDWWLMIGWLVNRTRANSELLGFHHKSYETPDQSSWCCCHWGYWCCSFMLCLLLLQAFLVVVTVAITQSAWRTEPLLDLPAEDPPAYTRYTSFDSWQGLVEDSKGKPIEYVIDRVSAAVHNSQAKCLMSIRKSYAPQ